LVKTTSKKVDHMTVVGDPLRKTLVELEAELDVGTRNDDKPYLDRTLVMLDTIAFNVVMGPDGFLQFVADNHTRTLRS
jgi:hypothetical protein